jgi:predicted N-acetyltransferase YhbS
MIEAGAASVDEYPRIREILARAFATADEADLWDYLVAHDPDLTSECMRVARLEGRIIACTVVLPRLIWTRMGLVRGAIVTLVACDPDYQRQGFGGASVRNALDYMMQRGLTLGMLVGHSTYYPRFGFVPVLDGAAAHLDVDSLWSGTPPLLRRIEQEDIPDCLELYTRQLGSYPCAPARSMAPWVWSPRHDAELVSAFGTRGYALVTVNRDRHVLQVHEACADSNKEDELLSAVLGRARQEDLPTVSLRMPPNHPLVQRAVALGARLEIMPPGPGMAVVLNWQPLLPGGYRLVGDVLMYLDRPVLRASVPLLVQLMLGSVDLESLSDDEVPKVLPEFETQLRHDFLPQFPHWSLEPYWF